MACCRRGATAVVLPAPMGAKVSTPLAGVSGSTATILVSSTPCHSSRRRTGKDGSGVFGNGSVISGGGGSSPFAEFDGRGAPTLQSPVPAPAPASAITTVSARAMSTPRLSPRSLDGCTLATASTAAGTTHTARSGHLHGFGAAGGNTTGFGSAALSSVPASLSVTSAGGAGGAGGGGGGGSGVSARWAPGLAAPDVTAGSAHDLEPRPAAATEPRHTGVSASGTYSASMEVAIGGGGYRGRGFDDLEEEHTLFSLVTGTPDASAMRAHATVAAAPASAAAASIASGRRSVPLALPPAATLANGNRSSSSSSAAAPAPTARAAKPLPVILGGWMMSGSMDSADAAHMAEAAAAMAGDPTGGVVYDVEGGETAAGGAGSGNGSPAAGRGGSYSRSLAGGSTSGGGGGSGRGRWPAGHSTASGLGGSGGGRASRGGGGGGGGGGGSGSRRRGGHSDTLEDEVADAHSVSTASSLGLDATAPPVWDADGDDGDESPVTAMPTRRDRLLSIPVHSAFTADGRLQLAAQRAVLLNQPLALYALAYHHGMDGTFSGLLASNLLALALQEGSTARTLAAVLDTGASPSCHILLRSERGDPVRAVLPLLYAVECEDADAVACLLRAGADPLEADDRAGHTALEVALKDSRTPAIRRMMRAVAESLHGPTTVRAAARGPRRSMSMSSMAGGDGSHGGTPSVLRWGSGGSVGGGSGAAAVATAAAAATAAIAAAAAATAAAAGTLSASGGQRSGGGPRGTPNSFTGTPNPPAPSPDGGGGDASSSATPLSIPRVQSQTARAILSTSSPGAGVAALRAARSALCASGAIPRSSANLFVWRSLPSAADAGGATTGHGGDDA